MSSVASSPVFAPETLPQASKETRLSKLFESIRTDLQLPSIGTSGEETSRYLRLADRLTEAFPENLSVITDLYGKHVNTKHESDVRSLLEESLMRLLLPLSEQPDSGSPSESDANMQREGVPLLVHSLVVDELLEETPGESEAEPFFNNAMVEEMVRVVMQNDGELAAVGLDAQSIYFKPIKIAVQVLVNTPADILQWSVPGIWAPWQNTLGDDCGSGGKDLHKRRAEFLDSLGELGDLERSQNLVKAVKTLMNGPSGVVSKSQAYLANYVQSY
jgi:hypothetical protein